MQHIDLICVGRLSAAYLAAGVAEYQKRLAGYCDFRIIELPEAPLGGKEPGEKAIAAALEKEGRAILASVRRGAALVALCVEGSLVSSGELAGLIETAAVRGGGDMAFVIGSSYGLAESVKRAAAHRISLGRITLPHQLARLVLTEQLYRAFSIIHNGKYHK